MSVKKAKISDLIPDSQNFNTGNEFGESLIEKSFSKFGAGRSILLDKNNKIIAGNKSTQKFVEGGGQNVVIVDADGDTLVAVRRNDIDLDTKRGREMALADNATAKANISWDETALTEWDMPIAEWGIVFDEVEEPGTADAEPQIDKAAELNEKWKVKSGDLWQIGSHRLVCGDSTDVGCVSRLMDGAKADCCVTDPPYGVLDEEWDRAFSQDDLDAIKSVTDGLIACFNAAKPSILLSMLSLSPMPERMGVWRHSHIAPKPGMIWSWQPVFYWNCGDAVAWDSLDWFQGNADRDGTHPTQKPIEFFAKIINSIDSHSVYEPFAGSGTTLVACENLNRKCYAIEISENYCAVILERMQTAFPSIEIKRIEHAEAAKT